MSSAPRRGLGRGLEVLIGGASTGTQLAELPVDAIHANPPHSSREILDPHAYFARKPSAPARRFDPKAPAGAIAAEHLGGPGAA